MQASISNFMRSSAVLNLPSFPVDQSPAPDSVDYTALSHVHLLTCDEIRDEEVLGAARSLLLLAESQMSLLAVPVPVFGRRRVEACPTVHERRRLEIPLVTGFAVVAEPASESLRAVRDPTRRPFREDDPDRLVLD